MSSTASSPSEPSALRRYAIPVLLGTILGVGALYLLSRLAAPTPTPPQPSPSDAPALIGDDPGVIVTVPPQRQERPQGSVDDGDPGAEEPDASAGPAPCPDGEENADCLVATLDSKWQVLVATDSAPADGVATVQAPMGGRLRWPAVSERSGLVTSFVVEADGGVLLIYPSPAGDSPVAESGIRFDVPRLTDTSGMKWNRPGVRRVFVLVSTVPFVAPDGLAAGRVATYYGAGDAAQGFFRSLRGQVHSDQITGDGEWALGEVRFDVRDDG